MSQIGKSDPDGHKKGPGWESAHMGERTDGRPPTWERGSDGKLTHMAKMNECVPVGKIGPRWESAHLGDRPYGREPTWERGSDGKIGPHGKNEPRWEKVDPEWKNKPRWEKMNPDGKSEPRWEKEPSVVISRVKLRGTFRSLSNFS